MAEEQTEAKRRELREGNDLLRKNILTPMGPLLGKILLTRGVVDNPIRGEVLKAVKDFYQFDTSNDPYHQHDFAMVEIESLSGQFCKMRLKLYEKFFFKIDYYDENFEWGADPYSEKVRRVLTIMKADEY